GRGHAVDGGEDRAVRTARLLPVPHPAAWPAAIEGRLPRTRGLEGCERGTVARWLPGQGEARVRPRDTPQMARSILLPLLQAFAVQAQRDSEFTEGVGRRRIESAR